MDSYGTSRLGDVETQIPNWIEETEAVRRNLGYTLAFANKMSLAAMVPENELSSTGYCLAIPGCEYLVYQPDSDPFTVNLEAFAVKSFSVEWFAPATGATTLGAAASGGSNVTLHPPFRGSAVAYLREIG